MKELNFVQEVLNVVTAGLVDAASSGLSPIYIICGHEVLDQYRAACRSEGYAISYDGKSMTFMGHPLLEVFGEIGFTVVVGVAEAARAVDGAKVWRSMGMTEGAGE